MNSPFSVVESRWWDEGNHSIRPLFEAVCAIHYQNPAASFYDMFAEASSLQTILQTRANDKVTEVLYLASHGDENNIGPNAANAVSRTKFRNILKDVNTSGSLRGLYFGTCLTGNRATAEFLLLGPETKLDWMAGYQKSVDWVDGSAIDMIFFGKLAQEYLKNKSKKKGKLSARQMAHEAASKLIKIVPGAYQNYGFNIYFRENTSVTSMFSQSP